jgi:hypothetical protein
VNFTSFLWLVFSSKNSPLVPLQGCTSPVRLDTQSDWDPVNQSRLELVHPYPHQGWVKKWSSLKRCLVCVSMCDFEFCYRFRVLALVSNSWNNFLMRFIFDLSLRGTGGEFFNEKKKSKKRCEIHTSPLSFECWFRISYQFSRNSTFSNQNCQITCQKQPKLRLWTSIRWTFLSGQYFCGTHIWKMWV